MKNKPFIDLLSRWVIVPLFVGGLIAWDVSAAYPVNTPPAHANDAVSKQVANSISANISTNTDIQEIKEHVKELEARERQNYALELEGQRKKVDWWLTFIGVLAAIMAIGGALIPFLMARKDKEIIEQIKSSMDMDVKSITQDKEQTRKFLDEVKVIKSEAESHLEKTRQSSAEAEKVLKKAQSGTPSALSEEVDEAVARVKQDKSADPLLKLRAEAIDAGKEKNADKAYKLWAALTALTADDYIAQFNAGYWAHILADSAQGTEKLQWLKGAEGHYAHALGVKLDMHDAANNWGAVLAAEARTLTVTNLDAARALWQQAREKYQIALRIKPDKHEAANNLGNALDAEARALAVTNLDAASTLWQQAGEKYQMALRIKPDKHEAANNWGSALDAEARAFVSTNPDAARTLWQQAAEKYQIALSIKSDLHEAASNWGSVLVTEASSVAVSDPEHSRQLLAKAEQLLLAHVNAAPGVVAYNLACVYGLRGGIRSCLEWLKVCQEHNTLPDCAHLHADKDLDRVREYPEFTEWLNTVCNDKKLQS